MRLAVVHYHLRRGGVARVIESSVAGLDLAGIGTRLAILTGEPPPADSPLAGDDRVRVVPGLGYRAAVEGPATAAALARELIRAATDALEGPPDLWHFHNPTLGKNVALPGVLDFLLREGGRLLLQLHDFAEDGRPENYRHQRAAADPAILPWHPSAGQVHYAVLQRRDAGILARAGLPPHRLHELPNPVSAPPVEPAGPPEFARGRRFFLYPVRGIRRKNVGELLLLSALTRDTHAWATTLRPVSPAGRAIHDRWESAARRLGLPVELGLAERPGHSYPRLLGAAEAAVTTSVAEGFGFAFLEPWLAGKPLVGRLLPETAPHPTAGDGLYQRLGVPARWIDPARLREKLGQALRSVHAAYGRALPGEAVETAWQAAMGEGTVDFGRLDEPDQEAILEKTLAHPGAVESPDLSLPDAELVARTAAEIAARFSPAANARRLEGIYRDIAAAPLTAVEALEGGRILDAFLDPARFHFLLT